MAAGWDGRIWPVHPDGEYRRAWVECRDEADGAVEVGVRIASEERIEALLRDLTRSGGGTLHGPIRRSSKSSSEAAGGPRPRLCLVKDCWVQPVRTQVRYCRDACRAPLSCWAASLVRGCLGRARGADGLPPGEGGRRPAGARWRSERSRHPTASTLRPA